MIRQRIARASQANPLRPANLLTIVLIGVFLWLNRSMPYVAAGVYGEPFGWPIPFSEYDRWDTGIGNAPRKLVNITCCIMLAILSSRRLGELEEVISAFRLQKVFGLTTAFAFLCSPLALTTRQEYARNTAAMQIENAAEAIAHLSVFLSVEFVVILLASRVSSRSDPSAVPETSWYIRAVSLVVVLLALIHLNAHDTLDAYILEPRKVESIVVDLTRFGGWPLPWQPESSSFHVNVIVDAIVGGLLLYCNWSSKQTAARLSRNRFASLIAALATICFAFRWTLTEGWNDFDNYPLPSHLLAISIVAITLYYDVMRSTATTRPAVSPQHDKTS